MEKKYTTRNKKRDSNLGTAETIFKVLIRIYWAKKEGCTYSITNICVEEKTGKLRKELVEGLYDWQTPPTMELAEQMRQLQRDYEANNWGKKDDTPAADSPIEATIFNEDPEVSEIVIVKLGGHMYRIERID